MSPLKIAIAAFVVGLIGLTESARNEAGSSSGSGPDHGATLTTTSDDRGNTSNFEYKPVSPHIGMQDVARVLEEDEITAYKNALIAFHRQAGQDGREELLASITPYENRARRGKLQRQAAQRARFRLARLRSARFIRARLRARLDRIRPQQLVGAQGERAAEIDLEYGEETQIHSDSSSPGDQ